MNGQRTLQLFPGFALINGLRKGVGAQVRKDFPVDDLRSIALEFISNDKLVMLPVGQLTHHYATSRIRTPALDDSVTVSLSVPPNDSEAGIHITVYAAGRHRDTDPPRRNTCWRGAVPGGRQVPHGEFAPPFRVTSPDGQGQAARRGERRGGGKRSPYPERRATD